MMAKTLYNIMVNNFKWLFNLVISVWKQCHRGALILRLTVFLMMFAPYCAFAHPEPKCFPIEKARESLAQLGMERIWRGVPGPIGVIELWVNKYGGFSIGLATNDGAAYCPMAEGSKSIRSKRDWPGVGT